MSNIAPEKLLACTLKILYQLTLQAFACGFIVWFFGVYARAFWYCFRDFIGSSTLRLGMRSLSHILQLVGGLCVRYRIRFVQRFGFSGHHFWAYFRCILFLFCRHQLVLD